MEKYLFTGMILVGFKEVISFSVSLASIVRTRDVAVDKSFHERAKDKAVTTL